MYRSFIPSFLKSLILTGFLLLSFFIFPVSASSLGDFPDPDSKNGPAKLLLSEISPVGTDQEYVEICNPGSEAVDLSDYYLTDANYTASNQFYYRIGEGNPNLVTVGGGAFNDFHARFPDGFFIAPGDTIVITVSGSTDFFNHFGFNPDLELYENGAIPDTVPDMRWVFGDEINNSIINRTGTDGGQPSIPTLTNACETIILYHFVTGEDKVTDIDVFAWQDPSSTTVNVFFNKTGITIGSHTYLPEYGTNATYAFDWQNDFGNSYHRLDFTEGDQTPTGSNGVDGRDETSENFNSTFAMMPFDPSSPPVPLPDPVKLLITEVSTIGFDQEYIEIHNPGDEAVDLSNYYLTDAIYNTGFQYYWRIAEGNPSSATVGGGVFYDFHARFPDGFSIAAQGSIVISLAGSTDFLGYFGFLPHLEMFEDDAAADNVPDMRWVFGDDINNSIVGDSYPNLTNVGETVVLYHWITGEDKVTDIDVFVWKDPVSATTTYFFNKTGITVGDHTYLPEIGTNETLAFSDENTFGLSYHRTDPTEGEQVLVGSNGVDGRDETSENFNTTFSMRPYDPTPTPVVTPDPPKLLITEVSTTGTSQEYIEIHNPGVEAVDLSDYYLTDAIYNTGNYYYWRIAEGNLSPETVGGGIYYDFHARFPEGLSLAAGDTIVISLAGSEDFYSHFGFDPSLEMYEDGSAYDAVPEMRWIFGDANHNSIVGDGTPGLTNGGETVVLYHWIPGEDKVTDIDVFAWKEPDYSTTSFFFNKTGVTIGSHSYLPEIGTNEDDAFGAQNSYGNSYQRIDITEGDQTPTGSNGIGGRDETSENFNTTFAMMPYDPVRSPEIIIPIEGDWQVLGGGPVVNYASDSHTWGDFDNNGAMDLLVITASPAIGSVLIHNVGILDSGLLTYLEGDPATPSFDGVRGDHNQNGTLDLYIAKKAGTDWFYNNMGEEWDWLLWGWPVDAFVNITPIFNTTDAAMVDTDLDGYLEIFVTNGSGNNQLLDGRYGLTDLLPHSLIHEPGTSGGSWCDLDGDRDLDLAYVSPSTGLAICYQEELRRFSTTWLPVPEEGRDCAWADFDNDGDFDFALTCLGSSNVIYENQGDGSFFQTPLVHAGQDSTTSCTWGDYDNDGFLDLHVTNTAGPNALWHNNAGDQFVLVSDEVIDDPGDDRGSSWVDIDADGDLDLYISNHDVVNRLVRNNLESLSNWLQISVKGHHWGNQSNHAALGAVIEVEAGGAVQRRNVGGQEAGPGHSPSIHHFGLGGAAIVDRITVKWPFRFPNGSFHSTEITDVAVNQHLEIEETVYGVSAVDPVPHYTNALIAAQPNPFNPVTVIGFSLERETMVYIDIFDVRGRLVQHLVSGESKSAGLHEVEWRGMTLSGSDAPSGVYIYRISAGGFSASRRMVMIR